MVILSFPVRSMGLPFDSIVGEIDRISFSNETKARELLQELDVSVKNDPENIRKQVYLFYCKSIICYDQGLNVPDLISDIHYCLDTLDRKSFLFERALLRYALALAYCTKGDYSESFTRATQAMKEFQQQDERVFAAKTIILLGNICTLIKSFKLAEDFYSQVTLSDGIHVQDYFHTCISRCNLLLYNEKNREAIDSLTALIPLLKTCGDPGVLARACMNLGGYYGAEDDVEKSLTYFLIIQNMVDSNKIDNKRITMTLYQNFGYHHMRVRNFGKAKAYFNKSKSIALENDNIHQFFYASYGLSQLFERWGKSDSAYIYMKECYLLRSRLSDNPRTIEVYQGYISELLKSSENELLIAEQEIELKNRRFSATLISSLGILLLSVLVLIVLQQKKKLKEAENRNLEKRLQHEVEIQQLQQEKIESQIREITSYSLVLFNKNRILQQVLDISQIRSTAGDELIEGNKKITRIIQNNLNFDNDWNVFRTHFDKVHPKFFDHLKSRCSELTENNLRVCAYFRIGMSSKQIAQILNVLPEAVRKMRFRLKKKLRIETEVSLDDFLRKL
jgi:DNA-binding CsgD family transcriptional regulator